jgi:hypothetical protein
MSTLPPKPTVNTSVPTIGPESGKESSYSDPNSSASIMRQTTMLNAQATTDTEFDIKGDIYEKKEKFQVYAEYKSSCISINYFFIFTLTILLFLIPHKLFGKLYLFLLTLSILTITILVQKHFLI